MIEKKWIMAALLAMLACVSGNRISAGQEPADPVVDTLQARVDQFLEGVSLGTTQTAYEELLAGSPLLQQTEALETLIQKTDDLESRHGQYRGFEPIAARRVGTDLVLLRYLYKCESFPVVFYFTFYRTPRSDVPTGESSNWRVITVRFDTELELLAWWPTSK